MKVKGKWFCKYCKLWIPLSFTPCPLHPTYALEDYKRILAFRKRKKAKAKGQTEWFCKQCGRWFPWGIKECPVCKIT